jgi:hypothetical protein
VSTKKLKVNVLYATDTEYVNMINDEVHALHVLQKVDANIVNTYPLLAPVGNPTVSIATVYYIQTSTSHDNLN